MAKFELKRADGRILIEVASVNEYIASLPAETYVDNAAHQQKEPSLEDCKNAFDEQMQRAKLDLFT